MGAQAWLRSKHPVSCSCSGCRRGVGGSMATLAGGFSKRLPLMDSLAETSVGLGEFSRELPSVPDTLTGGPSLEEPSHSLTAGPSFMTDMIEAQDFSRSIASAVPSEVVKTTIVRAVIELPPVVAASGEQSPKASGARKKCTLHVAPAPFHQCVAFDGGASDEERAKTAELLSGLLNPETRNRVDRIQAAGSFSRKTLVSRRPWRRPLPGDEHPGPLSARSLQPLHPIPRVEGSDYPSRSDLRPQSARPFSLQPPPASSRWTKLELDDAEGGGGAGGARSTGPALLEQLRQGREEEENFLKRFFPASANAIS